MKRVFLAALFAAASFGICQAEEAKKAQAAPAKEAPKTVAVGKQAPAFKIKDATGKEVESGRADRQGAGARPPDLRLLGLRQGTGLLPGDPRSLQGPGADQPARLQGAGRRRSPSTPRRRS